MYIQSDCNCCTRQTMCINYEQMKFEINDKLVSFKLMCIISEWIYCFFSWLDWNRHILQPSEMMKGTKKRINYAMRTLHRGWSMIWAQMTLFSEIRIHCITKSLEWTILWRKITRIRIASPTWQIGHVLGTKFWNVVVNGRHVFTCGQ